MTTLPSYMIPIPRYDPVAMTLHWTIAALILTMLPLGFFMGDFPISIKFIAYNAHKSIGLIIITLSIFRLVWRLLNPPPALPDSMRPVEKFLAHAAHWALYAFMILMPLSGWIMVSATPKFPIDFFGLATAPFLPMPQLADTKATGHFFNNVHYYLALGFIALLVLHIAAALQHHFIKRDTILRRMLPRCRRTTA